jgi:predicted acetyltransferase
VSGLEIRPCEPAEVREGLTPVFHFFGRLPTDDSVERLGGLFEPGRLQAAWEDGKAVGGAGALSFTVTVPGGRVPAAGVTVVGVLPTHRRRGILRAMMRVQLDDIHERAEPIACLWASEETIYGRFGYGIASLAGEVRLARNRSAFASPLERRGQARLLPLGEARDAVADVYERVAAQTPGMFARTDAWWDARRLNDSESQRGDAGELQCAVVDLDGRPEAYGLYRLKLAWDAGSSIGTTNVVEALGATPEATAEIWRYLLDVDWMDEVTAGLLPIDHPLFLLLAEPRRMRFRVGDALWVRLVDVAAALGARSLAGDGEVVIEVADAFCPWNEGRWRVGAAGVDRTDASAELRCDVSVLGSVYLGGFTWEQHARALRVEEVSPGAVARADALFGTDRAPWCPEIF